MPGRNSKNIDSQNGESKMVIIWKIPWIRSVKKSPNNETNPRYVSRGVTPPKKNETPLEPTIPSFLEVITPIYWGFKNLHFSWVFFGSKGCLCSAKTNPFSKVTSRPPVLLAYRLVMPQRHSLTGSRLGWAVGLELTTSLWGYRQLKTERVFAN